MKRDFTPVKPTPVYERMLERAVKEIDWEGMDSKQMVIARIPIFVIASNLNPDQIILLNKIADYDKHSNVPLLFYSGDLTGQYDAIGALRTKIVKDHNNKIRKLNKQDALIDDSVQTKNVIAFHRREKEKQ